VAKKRYIQQAKWHQEAISVLRSALEELTPFKDQLMQTKQVLFATFQGIDATKMKHQVSRSQKENRRTAKKRKDQRINVGVLGFLRRLTKEDLNEKCFPGGFPKHSTSQYIVSTDDLKDNLVNVIRPRMDQRFIDALLEKDTFSQEASGLVSNTVTKILKKCRNVPKIITDTTQDHIDSDIEAVETESTLPSLYIPIDKDTNLLSSSMESDIFDFVEVLSNEDLDSK
jgi:hypothetical protein